MKAFLKYATRSAIGMILALSVMTALFTFAPHSRMTRVLAQATGYRFAGNSLIFTGQGGGVLFENLFNGGSDTGFSHLGTGQVGQTNGGINFNPEGVVPPPPVIALATATTGGTIADATYRAVLIYVTPTGGFTNVAAAGEATQATTGGGLSTLTATAPIAAAGAAGYIVGVSPGGGATLTEIIQPITTAVCAGAFQVNYPYATNGVNQFSPTNGNPPAAPTLPGITVCPFGVNAVFTSLTTTGASIPLQNSAAFPSAVPQMVCNFTPTTTLATITTIQTFAKCVMAPGIQNVTGKVLHVTGHIIYTSGAQTGTMTISATEGGQTPVAITSGALVTGGQTNAQASFDYYITTALAGPTGKVEGHGTLAVNLATAANGNILSVYADQNTAAATAFDLTAANTLGIAITMTSSTTSATLRDAQVVLMN